MVVCIAVGTFEPGIEIWNLDVMDPLEPTAVLGGYAGDPTKKKKKNPTFKPGSHIDGVLGLSWNQVYRVALASASGDNTVKIWDVTTQKCSGTFTHHSDKVQSVQWHHQQAWLLASGGFDKMVALIDCRTGSVSGSYQLGADIEVLFLLLIHSYNDRYMYMYVCSPWCGIPFLAITCMLRWRMVKLCVWIYAIQLLHFPLSKLMRKLYPQLHLVIKYQVHSSIS